MTKARTYYTKRRTLTLGQETYLAGILNLTPDSFSDGGDFVNIDMAVQHFHQMVHEGATIIDIGGQDAKIIAVDSNRVDQFAINRKCAAGTGAFIEELAHRLEVPMRQMTDRLVNATLTIEFYTSIRHCIRQNIVADEQ